MMERLKQAAKRNPRVASVLGPAYAAAQRLRFRGSADYWEQRYVDGATSGVGSYGRLAEFKAEVLNEFVAAHGVTSVLELGCGDGAQLALMDYPAYTGVDVSRRVVDLCRTTFGGRDGHEFHWLGDRDAWSSEHDLCLSLDVVYHLVEDDAFHRHVDDLFSHARRFVIVYSSNMDQPTAFAHVRHREFTRHVAETQPGWRLERVVANRYGWDPARPDDTSPADFYVYVRA